MTGLNSFSSIIHSMSTESVFKVDPRLVDVSDIVMRDVLGVKAGESMLIVTNPDEHPLEISKSLFNAATKYEVEPTVIIQKRRSSDGKTDKRILAAISTMPNITISVSALSLGQDTGFDVLGQKYNPPYKYGDLERAKIFDIARNKGRGFWSPHITEDIWLRAVAVDYDSMKALGEKVASKLTNAKDIHITTDKGTDVTFSFDGMIVEPSTGPYKNIGDNGNEPTGEGFGTPVPGSTNGKLVFDGVIGGLSIGRLVLKEPVEVYVKDGTVVDVRGGAEARTLMEQLDYYTKQCYQMADKSLGTLYASNVRKIGEFGFGLNPKARLEEDSSIVEWEKALKTMHAAIGSDYGRNPKTGPPLNPTLNHFDGLIKEPSVTVDGKPLMVAGEYVF